MGHNRHNLSKTISSSIALFAAFAFTHGAKVHSWRSDFYQCWISEYWRRNQCGLPLYPVRRLNHRRFGFLDRLWLQS